jgi:hypothetical protein
MIAAIEFPRTNPRRFSVRVMMKVLMPVEPGNKAIKEGILGKTVMEFVEQMKPEACYFGPEDGKRTAYFFFDLKDPGLIPSVAEPFFMKLNAAVSITPVMNLEDMRTGVEKVMKHS